MNFGKLSVISTLALILTACGSGGSSPTVTNTATVKTPNKTTEKNVDIRGTSVSKKVDKKGRILAADIDPEFKYQGKINTLIVKGKEIQLIPNEINFSGNVLRLQDSKEKRVIGNNLQYARYGEYTIVDDNGDVTSHEFYQGQVTPEKAMPTKGEASYKGLAFYNKEVIPELGGKGDNLNNILGESSFKVNFGTKKITGEISSPTKQFDTLNFKADISSNYFVTNVDDAINTGNNIVNSMEGAFYGPKAEEMSGRFSSMEKGTIINGTFGASKQ